MSLGDTLRNAGHKLSDKYQHAKSAVLDLGHKAKQYITGVNDDSDATAGYNGLEGQVAAVPVKAHTRVPAGLRARLGLTALLLIGAATVSKPAYADLSMTVQSEANIGDYVFALPGNELNISCLVTNTSSPFDTGYSLSRLIIPAGSDNSVFAASGPTDWTVTINPDNTVFDVGSLGSYIAPLGGQGTFNIYATDLGIAQGNALAYSRFGEPFPTVPVDIPSGGQTPVVPEPSSVILGSLGLGLVQYLRTRGWIDSHKKEK